MIERPRNENKSMTKMSAKRLGIFLTIPLMIGFIVLYFLAFQWKKSLVIDQIILTGSHILQPKQLLLLADVQKNSSMNTLDIYGVQQRVYQQPFVKSVKVTRNFPSTICIDVSEREPIASLNNGQLRYVDADAVLLPYIETANKLDLPIISGISGIQQANIGEAISNEELSNAIKLLQTAIAIDSTLYHFISEVHMNGEKDIVLYSTDIGVPIIVGQGDFGKKLLMLQTFWSNYIKSQNAQKLRFVDLRFNDQVVVKWLQDEHQTNL